MRDTTQTSQSKSAIEQSTPLYGAILCKREKCWLIVMPISVFLKVKLMLVIIISELVYVHFLLVILYTVISVTA